MWRDLKHSLRLIGIGWTLARYNALFVFDALNPPTLFLLPTRLIPSRARRLNRGQRLSRALQAMGPSFIKAGQALSTRGDLIGEDIAAGLTELQDRLPPYSTTIARRTVEEQLGAPITSLFVHFENESIAAASIAQVHFATTYEGKEVAVKILRPNIEAQFKRDIEFMHWLADAIEKRRPQLRRLKLREVVRTFEETIRIELDLRFEAAAADELRANTRNDSDFYVPTVDWQRTAKRVLVTERIRGISAGDIEGLKKAGIDLNATMERAARSFFNQVFRDGFFHADMHPGNLFVLPDGRLAPVDFGIMGRVSHEDQLILAQILWAFLNGEYQKVAELHHDAGWIPPHVNVDQFAQACRAVGSPILGKAMNEISVGKLFGQLLSVAKMFEMETQPRLILLQKTMVTAEGVGRNLNPNVNMWQISEPLIRKWAESNLSARARLRTHLREGLELLKDAPRVLREVKDYLESERKPETVIITQTNNSAVMWAWGGWLIAALLATIIVIAAAN